MNCPKCKEEGFDCDICKTCGFGSGLEAGGHSNPGAGVCPKCHRFSWNGWKCSECGHEIPDKAKTAHPRVLGPEEAAALKKKLGIE